jgi:hypothetical protein
MNSDQIFREIIAIGEIELGKRVDNLTFPFYSQDSIIAFKRYTNNRGPDLPTWESDLKQSLPLHFIFTSCKNKKKLDPTIGRIHRRLLQLF